MQQQNSDTISASTPSTPASSIVRFAEYQYTPSAAAAAVEAAIEARQKALQHVIDTYLRESPAFLKLTFYFIDASLLQQVFYHQIIAETTSLKYLDLSGNYLGDRGAALLAEFLLKNGSLEYLNISANGIGPDGCILLCNALRYIDDDEPSTQDVGTATASALQPAATPDSSDSSEGPATPSSLRRKSSKLGMYQKLSGKGNRTLYHLDLSLNYIGYGGIAALGDMLRHNNTLTHINVRSNRTNNEKCVKKLLELAAIAQNKITIKDLFI